MTGRSGDAAFEEFASEQRERLLGAAYLMYGDRERAQDVVEASLAELYRRWPGTDPERRVLSSVLRRHPGRLVLPWRRGERVELLDAPSRQRPVGIVADLSGLEDDVRRAVICQRYLALPPGEIAAVLDTDIARVEQLAGAGTQALAAQEENAGVELSTLLRSATRADATPSSGPASPGPAAEDLRHGRLLVRRRRLRSVLAVVAALVAVLLIVPQLRSKSAPSAEEPAATAPVPSPTATATCDTRGAACRAAVMRGWQQNVYAVTTSHLDPDQRYFSVANSLVHGDGGDPLSDGFWEGRDGALGLGLTRPGGATSVYLQIATARSSAVRCGQLTRQRCVRQQFLDGFSYNLT